MIYDMIFALVIYIQIRFGLTFKDKNKQKKFYKKF